MYSNHSEPAWPHSWPARIQPVGFCGDRGASRAAGDDADDYTRQYSYESSMPRPCFCTPLGDHACLLRQSVANYQVHIMYSQDGFSTPTPHERELQVMVGPWRPQHE